MLWLAIPIAILCLTGVQSVFYYAADNAWEYYVAMLGAEVIITAAIYKAFQSERGLYTSLVFLLSVVNYFIGFVSSYAYSNYHITKLSAGSIIEGVEYSSSLLVIALLTIACIDAVEQIKRA